MKDEHRKRIKHYHQPGDFHLLTFSCFHRMPLLTNDAWRCTLARSIDAALERWNFRLHAFVFMPEHVHLLTFPEMPEPLIDKFLGHLKQRTSVQIKRRLLRLRSPLLPRLTVRERPGKTVFRFWQEGPGHDRNLRGVAAVLAAIDYIHLNPVKRGLCERIEQWKWSSACFMLDLPYDETELPRLHRLPAELFD